MSSTNLDETPNIDTLDNNVAVLPLFADVFSSTPDFLALAALLDERESDAVPTKTVVKISRVNNKTQRLRHRRMISHPYLKNDAETTTGELVLQLRMNVKLKSAKEQTDK